MAVLTVLEDSLLPDALLGCSGRDPVSHLPFQSTRRRKMSLCWRLFALAFVLVALSWAPLMACHQLALWVRSCLGKKILGVAPCRCGPPGRSVASELDPEKVSAERFMAPSGSDLLTRHGALPTFCRTSVKCSIFEGVLDRKGGYCSMRTPQMPGVGMPLRG